MKTMSGVARSNSADFVEDARRRHGIDRPIALGYSNGANIAAALMLLLPGTLAGAALLRAMVPLSDPPHPDLSRVPVLIASGKADPIVPAPNAAKLAAMLRDAGADVSHEVLPVGHQLSQADLVLMHDWLGQSKRSREWKRDSSDLHVGHVTKSGFDS